MKLPRRDWAAAVVAISVTGFVADRFLGVSYTVKLMYQYNKLRDYDEAPEVGRAMISVLEASATVEWIGSGDHRLPESLRKMGGKGLYVNPSEGVARLGFGGGHFGFAYSVEARPKYGCYSMDFTSDRTEDNQQWVIDVEPKPFNGE